MYLKRKIDSYLTEWYANPKRLPLVIKGSRQIGKTRSVLHFAEQVYESIVKINFVEEPVYRSIAETSYRVEDIIKNISLIDPSKQFIEGKTLFFFDEIQTYPDLATALKFFALDGRYDVICCGSLLEINYQQIESNSVGYKTDYEMFSLDFEEFLWARGYDQRTVDSIANHMIHQTPFDELELEVFRNHFFDYCVLGGMPAVVSLFVEQGNFSNTLSLQRQLVADYREDIHKYAEGLDKTRILNIFDHIPVQLAKENKKFQIGKVAKGARFGDYRGCIEWLATSGMADVCYCLNYPELPLRGNYDSNKYKVYFSDNGLLIAMLDDEAAQDFRVNKNLGVYKGALYESIAADALVRQNYGLYYYKKPNSTLEEDFFVRSAHNLIPVEVKARNARAKSLRTLITSSAYPDIEFGVKFCDANIGLGDNVYTFPLFCMFKLREFLESLS